MYTHPDEFLHSDNARLANSVSPKVFEEIQKARSEENNIFSFLFSKIYSLFKK